MIGFYNVSEMQKSLIDFWEMRHLPFFSGGGGVKIAKFGGKSGEIGKYL